LSEGFKQTNRPIVGKRSYDKEKMRSRERCSEDKYCGVNYQHYKSSVISLLQPYILSVMNFLTVCHNFLGYDSTEHLFMT
jgi:hypothetical protein